MLDFACTLPVTPLNEKRGRAARNNLLIAIELARVQLTDSRKIAVNSGIFLQSIDISKNSSSRPQVYRRLLVGHYLVLV